MTYRPTVVVVLAVVLTVACSDSSGSTTSGSSAPTSTSVAGEGETRVVLDGGGCHLEGDSTMAPGSVVLAIANQTTESGFFELVEIGEDGSHALLEEHVAAEANRLQSGEPQVGPPPYISQLGRTEVEASGQGELAATVDRGLVAAICGHAGSTIYVTEPITIE